MKKIFPALLLSVAGALIAYTIASNYRQRADLRAAGIARYGVQGYNDLNSLYG